MVTGLQSYEANLVRLAAQLPPSSEAAAGDDADRQARATLSFAVERAGLLTVQAQAVPVNPSTCPNCDAPAASERSPYCRPACREESAFVRQLRNGLVEGSVFDVERQASLGQVLWHLLGGGYPRRQTLVKERARARVLQRNGGKCEVCDAPAETFDHVGSACNREINLRSVCWNCTLTRPFGDKAFLNRPEIERRLDGIGARIGSVTPLRCCDDAATWDWRDYLKSRSHIRQ